jgi:hypothetical protein
MRHIGSQGRGGWGSRAQTILGAECFVLDSGIERACGTARTRSAPQSSPPTAPTTDVGCVAALVEDGPGEMISRSTGVNVNVQSGSGWPGGPYWIVGPGW